MSLGSVKVRAEGDAQWRSRLVLLPEDAAIDFSPGEQPNCGRLHFRKWALCSVTAVQGDVRVASSEAQAEFTAEVEYAGSGHPPEWLELDLAWPGNPNQARIRVPFPARGGRLFAGAGGQLPDDAILPVGGLIGTRIVGFLGGAAHAQLELAVAGGNAANATVHMSRTIYPPAGSRCIEVRLIDFQADLQRMLASLDTLDAQVRVSLRVGGSVVARLRVARYVGAMERDAAGTLLQVNEATLRGTSTETLSRTVVGAIRLDAPGDEIEVLAQVQSAGVPTGTWHFETQGRDPGPWFLFPPTQSSLALRPLLWVIGGEPAEAGGLGVALRVADEAERDAAIGAALEALAKEHLHPDWSLVDRLAAHLGHLPLSALDLWRRFIRDGRAMAAMALRLNGVPRDLLRRFPGELPFAFELVATSAWAAAIEQVHACANHWYGSDVGPSVATAHVRQRIEDLASQYPALRVNLEAANATTATGESSPDVRMALSPAMDEIFRGQLFDGRDCRLQSLLRHNAEAQWPESLAHEVACWRKRSEFTRYLSDDAYGFHDSVINVPVLAALSAVTDQTEGWLTNPAKVRELRVYQSFDPDWFSEAYDLTVARCLSTGLLGV